MIVLRSEKAPERFGKPLELVRLREGVGVANDDSPRHFLLVVGRQADVQVDQDVLMTI